MHKHIGDAAMVVLLVAIGFLLGLAAATDTGAENWLKYWETLVAGSLAVVAAAMTVLVMIRVDMAQQKRHEDLVELNRNVDKSQQTRHEDLLRMNIRSERLVAERAALVDPQELRWGLDQFADGMATFRSNPTESLLVRSALDRLKDTLARSTIKAARPLFGGELEYHYSEALSAVKIVRDYVEKLNAGALGKYPEAHSMDFNRGQLNLILPQLTDSIQFVAAGLEGLHRDYLP